MQSEEFQKYISAPIKINPYENSKNIFQKEFILEVTFNYELNTLKRYIQENQENPIIN